MQSAQITGQVAHGRAVQIFCRPVFHGVGVARVIKGHVAAVFINRVIDIVWRFGNFLIQRAHDRAAVAGQGRVLSGHDETTRQFDRSQYAGRDGFLTIFRLAGIDPVSIGRVVKSAENIKGA